MLIDPLYFFLAVIVAGAFVALTIAVVVLLGPVVTNRRLSSRSTTILLAVGIGGSFLALSATLALGVSLLE